MSVKTKIASGGLLILAVVSVIFFQSCLPSEDNYYDANKYFKEDAKTLKSYIETNKIVAQYDSATGVYIQVHKRGTGYKTLNNVDIEFHYRGFTLDGVEFINSFTGNPVPVKLGNEETYPGAFKDAVLIGLFSGYEGDSITVYSPSFYGFKDQGYSNVAPNTPVAYTIKFVDIKKLDEEYAKIDQYITAKGFTAAIDTVFGTRTVRHVAGSTIKIDNNDYVTLDYKGVTLDDKQFDTSYGKTPLGFTVGQGKLIPGFELGVSQLNNLDSATIFVPSIYGYGAKANGDIPANSVLVFGIKINNVNKYL